MTLLVRKELITVELESTYRDATAPDVNDAVFCYDVSWNNEAKMLDRNGPSNSLATFRQTYGGRTATLTFKVEIKGSGTEGTAPEYDKLLKICGFDSTIVASTSVTYKPETYTSSTFPSGAVYYYQDGRLKIMRGVRGNVKFVMNAQEFGYMEFTLHGHPTNDSDTAILNPSYASQLPPQFVGSNLNFASAVLSATKLEIDMQNEIIKPLDTRADNGIGEIRVGSRNPMASVDPEGVLVATNPIYTSWTTNASGQLDSGLIGTTAGNRYQFTMPAAYIKDIQEADRDGLRTQDIQFGLTESSEDDEISFVLT